MPSPIKVTVWNEFRHERSSAQVAKHYPSGIHVVLADALTVRGFETRVAVLDDSNCGISDSTLQWSDVLVWWGHAAHAEVPDSVVDAVVGSVRGGMGFVCLHSAHHSKVFKELMGTSCDLQWDESGESERVWTVSPEHPIAAGLPASFHIPQVEMYGEPFKIPQPDETVFISSYASGRVFRSGCCFQRDQGRVFYFSTGHETFPIYHQREIQEVIGNACRWAAKGWVV